MQKLTVALPLTHTLDLARAFAALGTTMVCALQECVQRKLEKNDWTSFGRVWRAPYYLEVALRLGRRKFHHYYPYVRVVEDDEAQMGLATQVVLNLPAVLDRASRRWALTVDEGKVFEQVILRSRTNGGAAAALTTEGGTNWSEKMVEAKVASIYRRCHVPQDPNPRVWLTHQFWRLALEEWVASPSH
jgi:hypothetical protein